MPPETKIPFPKFNSDVVYLSARDLARRYGVHVVTIFKWKASGILPPGELISPNCRRWRSDQLAAFEVLRQETQQD